MYVTIRLLGMTRFQSSIYYNTHRLNDFTFLHAVLLLSPVGLQQLFISFLLPPHKHNLKNILNAPSVIFDLL